mmetsp:Transcript_12145/g.38969  ORF Transcript_12145/g.38969 Transcript_12145/m.38969 type:complete len:511 (-) Transcript_12145:53-1585(-)
MYHAGVCGVGCVWRICGRARVRLPPALASSSKKPRRLLCHACGNIVHGRGRRDLELGRIGQPVPAANQVVQKPSHTPLNHAGAAKVDDKQPCRATGPLRDGIHQPVLARLGAQQGGRRILSVAPAAVFTAAWVSLRPTGQSQLGVVVLSGNVEDKVHVMNVTVGNVEAAELGLESPGLASPARHDGQLGHCRVDQPLPSRRSDQAPPPAMGTACGQLLVPLDCQPAQPLEKGGLRQPRHADDAAPGRPRGAVPQPPPEVDLGRHAHGGCAFLHGDFRHKLSLRPPNTVLDGEVGGADGSDARAGPLCPSALPSSQDALHHPQAGQPHLCVCALTDGLYPQLGAKLRVSQGSDHAADRGLAAIRSGRIGHDQRVEAGADHPGALRKRQLLVKLLDCLAERRRVERGVLAQPAEARVLIDGQRAVDPVQFGLPCLRAHVHLLHLCLNHLEHRRERLGALRGVRRELSQSLDALLHSLVLEEAACRGDALVRLHLRQDAVPELHPGEHRPRVQ